MPRWIDFLDRFRPAGTPGAAVPRGVPLDRSGAAAAELLPVLARLDRTQEAADRIGRQALSRADRIRRAGADAAAQTVSQARARVEYVAAQSESDRYAELEAERKAAVVHERGSDVESSDYAAQVVAVVHSMIAGVAKPTKGSTS